MLVWIIVLSIGFFGIKGGVFTILSGGEHRVWGPPGSFIEDNNALALAQLMILPLLYYLRSITENKWVKWGLLGAMFLTAISAFGSYSRGAFLAVFAMAFFLLIKSRQKFMVGILVILTIPMMFAFMPEQWHERIESIQNYQEDRSALGRINAWAYSINVASNRLLGAGFESWYPETFQVYAPDPTAIHAAHSIYFSVIADHGWIGFGLFMMILLMAWRAGSWVIKRTKRNEELIWASDLARMIQVSLVAYGTGGAFLSLSYFDLPWHMIAILVLLKEIVGRELEYRNEVSIRHGKVQLVRQTDWTRQRSG